MPENPLPSRLVLLLVLAAAASLPAAAELQDVRFDVQPPAPTWRDDVSVTVEGTSDCVVEFHDAFFDFVVDRGVVLRIEVDEHCIVDPPSFQPFSITAHLGQVTPGFYPVLVSRAGDEQDVLAEGRLIVYTDADVDIDVLADPPTDDQPFTIRVTGVTDACGEPESAEVDGNVIRILFTDGCRVLPPGSFVQSFDVTVGPLPAGDYEIHVFRGPFSPAPDFEPLAVSKATVHVFDHELCLPESDVLCLNQDRFAVRVQWEDFQGGSGVGQAVPFRDDTGLFWFFHPENVELTVKVLEGCPVNGFFWVFIASGSTVEYEIRVTDTARGETAVYRNALGQVPHLIPDTAAFACP